MHSLGLSIVVGIGIGIVDILPMIKMKLPRHTILASFVHFLVATIVIFHIRLPYVPWWVAGGVVGLALMTPMLIHVGHDDAKPLPIIAANAVVFGTVAGVAAHFLV